MDEILDEKIFNESNEGYQFYRGFHNVEEAKAFANLLEKNDIYYRLETSDTLIDSAIVGTGLIPKAVLKLLPQDFKKVKRVLENHYSKFSSEDLKDHHLNLLDDQELEAIFLKPEEWSVEDFYIAKQLLKFRGKSISDEEIESIRQQSLEKVREGKKENPLIMFLYLVGIVVGLFLSVLFIIAGVGMGYYYAYGKTLDQDGNKYFVYEPTTRFYGKIVLYMGLLALVLEFLFFADLIPDWSFRGSIF